MIAQLKNILYKANKKWQKKQYQKNLKTIVPEVPIEGTHVNYGNVLKINSGQIIDGGRVKLLHLQKEFPENLSRFNVLYLVSSAQPPFAEELVSWAKKHGAKFIWNQDGVAYPAWAGPFTLNHNHSMRSLIQGAEYVIYQSEFCRSSANKYLGSVSVPSEILYNSVDTDFFCPCEPEIPSTPWTLLTAGTHQQPERVLSVLKTVAVLNERKKPVCLILAGRLDWPLAQEEVQKTIRNLGIKEQVLFLPPYTQDEAPSLYQKAHILVHLKYKDPCPTVVIEAMACGLPVIGSNSGGMPELVGKEGGILIDVPDSWDQMYYPSAEKIADAVEEIFEDLSRWQFKARGRAVQHFDKNSWIDRHKRIFNLVRNDLT